MGTEKLFMYLKKVSPIPSISNQSIVENVNSNYTQPFKRDLKASIKSLAITKSARPSKFLIKSLNTSENVEKRAGILLE